MNLHELVEHGDAAALKKAIAAGADVNHSFPDSDESLLSAAAYQGNSELVQLLLELGADPNYPKTVTPSLTAAVQSGSMECVQALIQAGAEINVRDEEGSTPLIDASACGQVAIVQELLSNEANPKLKDSDGNSAVFYAADRGHQEVLELLAPVSSPKERDKARIAAEFSAQNVSAAYMDEVILAVSRGDFAHLESLINSGCSPDTISADGTSALMMAANKNHIEIVALASPTRARASIARTFTAIMHCRMPRWDAIRRCTTFCMN